MESKSTIFFHNILPNVFRDDRTRAQDPDRRARGGGRNPYIMRYTVITD